MASWTYPTLPIIFLYQSCTLVHSLLQRLCPWILSIQAKWHPQNPWIQFLPLIHPIRQGIHNRTLPRELEMISTKNRSPHSRACGWKIRIGWRRVDGIIALVILCVVTAQHLDYSVNHVWRVLHFSPIFSLSPTVFQSDLVVGQSIIYAIPEDFALLFAQAAIPEIMPPFSTLDRTISGFLWVVLLVVRYLFILFATFASHSPHCTYHLLGEHKHIS